ncbi:unnamed protein product [Polarella glacialis]|uniref:Dynamin N-terminal domain-containing protein n=1 Tax=Polarella glacialis TaxID=89957 RepID=A0A813KEZ2_POLGL|nr:unnamed protein product [Polarella glacialis]
MEPTRTREQQHGLADLSSFAHELVEELEVDSWPGAESYREHVNVIDTLACEKDQLVVVGCGNAGKSSFCNQLLGEKLWPVTKCCLGLPLCEACYGSERFFSAGASNTEEFSFYAIEGIASAPEVASDMAGTSSTTEGEGLAPQQQEQEEGPEPLWHVQLPSPLLEPGIVLVDTPGFDGKVECRKAIENYLFSAPRLSEVVVVYLIDANRGISWPDRDFFQLLLQPGCGQVALQMILLLNKCDGRSTCNDEEEDQRMECPRILAEIESELSKYSITQVLPLSLKEARQGVPEALQELAVIEAKIDGALAALKSERIKLGKGQLADLIRKIGDTLEAEHDKHRQLLRVARRLDEATCNRPSWTEMRPEGRSSSGGPAQAAG